MCWDSIPDIKIRQHHCNFEPFWVNTNRRSRDRPHDVVERWEMQAYDSYAHLDITWSEVMFRDVIWWRSDAGIDLEVPKGIIRDVMLERTCFITKNGRFGICHPSAQPGDIVVSIPNVRTPFIMRTWTKDELAERFRDADWYPAKARNRIEEDVADKECLKMICDCYIHEIMKNETPLRIRDYCDMYFL